MSNQLLKTKALQIAGGLKLEGFRASCGWLSRWKRRYGVGVRVGTNSAQRLPADYADHLHTFRKSVIVIRKAENIGPATASGKKLPAMIVFKERGGSLGVRVWRSLHIPPNVRVRATTNGWMTAQEYQHWLAHVYGKESQRCLLIVDIYKPHQTDDSIKKVKESCNSDVIIIPGGCTSIVQPMDKCINRPFKENVRASWQEWMQQDRGNLKQLTRQDAINWVSRAWDSIKPETLTHSFVVCGISNALDGSEDDLVSDDLPSVEIEEEADEQSESSDCEDEEADIDEVNPFSEDSDSDPE